MKVGLALALLAVGGLLSTWVSLRVVRTRPGESLQDASIRIGRRVVAGMGYMITSLLVMVLWLSDTASDTAEALETAKLAAQEAAEVAVQNCQNQVADQELFEKVLVADVRIARGQYTAAVSRLNGLQQDLDAPVADFSGLPPAEQAYLESVYSTARERVTRSRDAQIVAVNDLATELDTREASLDEARAVRITDCPTVPAVIPD